MSEGETVPGPLADVLVLEMGHLLAGPFCGHLLADFGAEVIKVEPPERGDPMREWGHVRADETPLWWPILARNKKSVTIDLRQKAGQHLARELVQQTDVLIENFRPGTLERWGMSYQELSQLNPGLVLVRVTGFGQDGPYAARAAYGSIGEAMGGIRHITGDPDRPPSRTGISLGDSLAGTFAALGCLMALHERARTGVGQVVDAAIYEAVLAFMESMIPEYQLGGYVRGRHGPILPQVAPSNVYETADGGYVLIAANQDSVFARLTVCMGQPELSADERFSTHASRGEHQHELDKVIASWTKGSETHQLLENLTQHGVPSGLVYTAAEMLEDPHFRARRAIVSHLHPVLGDFPMQGVFPVLSRTPGGVRHLGPQLGEHNRDVLGRLLGRTDEELEGLRLQGTI
jgi:formyl-CoA transferase